MFKISNLNYKNIELVEKKNETLKIQQETSNLKNYIRENNHKINALKSNETENTVNFHIDNTSERSVNKNIKHIFF